MQTAPNQPTPAKSEMKSAASNAAPITSAPRISTPGGEVRPSRGGRVITVRRSGTHPVRNATVRRYRAAGPVGQALTQAQGALGRIIGELRRSAAFGLTF